MKKKTLYVFGNEHVGNDGFAQTIAKEMKGFDVQHCRSPDDLLDAQGDILILDVVKGIQEPIVIEDISQLKTRKMVSLHDFDVGFFLNLMNGMGIGKKIKILGVPEQGNGKNLAKKVMALMP